MVWSLALVACGRDPSPAVLDPASRAPLDRAIAVDEPHRYRIALAAGEYLQLRVDQHGVDLAVTLSDPRGRSLLEVDNPSGADGSRGPERVAWVAGAAGDHDLTVRVVDGWDRPGRYRLAVEALRPAGDEDRRRAVAEAAIAAGDAALYSGDRDARAEAIDHYEDALAIFAALGDRVRHADALFRLAKTRQRLGEDAAAIALYRRAFASYRALGNPRQQAITLFQLCQLHNAVPDVDRALEACGRALPLWQRTADRRGLALTWNELGQIHRWLGDSHRAIDAYDRALVLWRELGDRATEAKVLHNRGRVYDVRGERTQAIDDLRAALAIQREIPGSPEIVYLLNSLGQLHDRHGELEEARRYFLEALEVRDGRARWRAIALAGLARVEARAGDPRRALALYDQARETFSRRGDRDWEAVVLHDVGTVHAARGELATASELLDRALTLRRRIHDRPGEAETLLAMARVERRRGELETAWQRSARALEIVDDLRTRISRVSTARADYQALKQDYFDFHVDLLMALHERDPARGYGARALTASERARSRALLQLLDEGGVDLERGVDPALLARKRGLERQIQTLELLLVRGAERPSAGEVERIERAQRDLLRRHEMLEEKIRAASPRYAALARPRTLTAEEIRAHIVDRETALLEYQLGEARSFLWVVTPEGVTSHVLPGRDEIEPLALRAHELVAGNRRRSRQRLRKDLARLSAMLLAPAAETLRASRRLLIVPEGALHLLPFGALPAPGAADPLVAGHELVTLPSASTLAALREQTDDRPPAPGLLAVIADPVYGNGAYPRLVHARDEAERILSRAPAAARFEATGLDASLETVTGGALGRYRIVHFATHGELDMTHPELSRLVLSLVDETGAPRDGFLDAFEIYDLELAAELVVLSACQTAVGPRVRGEGLVGLTRGFLHAGARRVVVSLWQVDDRSTAELMKRFYDRLLSDGLSPPAALRAAQDSLRREPRWREPYYWAGFVLQGEWRDLPGG